MIEGYEPGVEFNCISSTRNFIAPYCGGYHFTLTPVGETSNTIPGDGGRGLVSTVTGSLKALLDLLPMKRTLNW